MLGILKNCQTSIEPDAGAKSRFLMSARVFAIAGIKQREHVNCRIYPELGSTAAVTRCFFNTVIGTIDIFKKYTVFGTIVPFYRPFYSIFR